MNKQVFQKECSHWLLLYKAICELLRKGKAEITLELRLNSDPDAKRLVSN